MKILVVSHFYPPLRDGGYAQLCAEVCQGLAARGHEIYILTSRYGVKDDTVAVPGIYRLLYLENDLLRYSPRHFFTRWIWEENQNTKNVRKLVDEIKPDIAFIWGMYGLSRSVPQTIEQLLPENTIYFISDLWPADPSFNENYWNEQAASPFGRITKPLAAPVANMILKAYHYPPKLQFRHAMIVSHVIKRKLTELGLPFMNSSVIYSGTDVSQYYFKRDYGLSDDRSTPIRFLYAGRLVRLKGVHTILEACKILRSDFSPDRFKVHIYGSGDPDYIREIEQAIVEFQLKEYVSLEGSVSHQQIPNILRHYDILITPSINDDPLPRIVQEGMLSGMPVIGSNRGGIPEMIDPDVTGLIFTAGNAEELADSIRKLLDNRIFAVNLAKAGQKKALVEFDLEIMINNVATFLQDCYTPQTTGSMEISTPPTIAHAG
jgi:glycogen(starch) synthase